MQPPPSFCCIGIDFPCLATLRGSSFAALVGPMFHRVVKSDGRCKDWPAWPISPPERLSRCRDPRDHSAGVLFLHDTNSHHTHYRKVELWSTESRSQGGFSVPTEPLPRIDPSSDQSCTPLRARPPALPLLRVIGPLFPSWIRAPYPPPPVTDPSLRSRTLRKSSRRPLREKRQSLIHLIAFHSTQQSFLALARRAIHNSSNSSNK